MPKQEQVYRSAVEALVADLAEAGIRFDLTPTMHWLGHPGPITDKCAAHVKAVVDHQQLQFAHYLRRIAESIQGRAQEALAIDAGYVPPIVEVHVP